MEHKKDIHYLDEESFLRFYGEAPWNYMNKIFETIGMNYNIQPPQDGGSKEEFILYLLNKIDNSKVRFEDLSTGERALVTIALEIYNIRKNKGNTSIILLDEPDASLHPSMIKYLLRILDDIFVKEKGIKVILTTHNPTTLALAPEGSIYTMTRNSDVIRKTSKDAALKILTEGVPSFSVNYENRRQVFVESINDVEYYERLYQIFNKELIGEISLMFISSGESRTNSNGTKVSNCGQVINICDFLRNNKFIFGIIDFDNENISKENIKVLGEGKRYAIENYLLDPILLAVFMLIEMIVKPNEIGLEVDDNYLSIENFENEKLQIIVDKILDKIKQHSKVNSEEVYDCYLVNGRKIKIPIWFLLGNQGHPLEKAVKKAFPGLDSYNKNGDKTLKLAIINKVIAIFPGLASVDLIKILQDVQE